MIDLHCHLLPGVDDGAKTIEETVSLARLAVSEGIQTIVATPHFGMFERAGARSAIERAVAEAQSAIDAAGLPLRLLTGSEIVLTPETARWFDAGDLVSLAGSRTLLVEVPFHEYPRYADEALFQLQTRGAQPVLAHPERYSVFQQDPARLAPIVERGVLTQVTAGSLLGLFGKTAKTTAEVLLRRSLVHVIATDAHTPVGRRNTEVVAALQRATELVGEARAQAMVRAMPEALLQDQVIELPAVEPAGTGAGWAFWRRWGVGAAR